MNTLSQKNLITTAKRKSGEKYARTRTRTRAFRAADVYNASGLQGDLSKAASIALPDSRAIYSPLAVLLPRDWLERYFPDAVQNRF